MRARAVSRASWGVCREGARLEVGALRAAAGCGLRAWAHLEAAGHDFCLTDGSTGSGATENCPAGEGAGRAVQPGADSRLAPGARWREWLCVLFLVRFWTITFGSLKKNYYFLMLMFQNWLVRVETLFNLSCNCFPPYPRASLNISSFTSLPSSPALPVAPSPLSFSPSLDQSVCKVTA